jgi:SNF2 family DNA or RNA helicase
MVERKKMLVGYDLGTGKTVITIAAIEQLFDSEDITEPVLVVCLSSLKYQWQKEVHKFSDSRAVVIDGTRKQREQQYQSVRKDRPDYVIVNYEMLVNDADLIEHTPFGALVMDEATAIKAFKAKRSIKAKKLAKTVDVRFALTGTPIENGKPEELYSIMSAVDPSLLGERFDLFDSTFIVRNKFGGVERYRNLPVLHERLKEAVVRKTQNDPDVAPYLPDTIIRDPMWVPLDRHSAILYRRISALLQDELEEAQATMGSNWSLEAHYGQGRQQFGPGDALRGSIMSKVTALRMLCDHPKLLASSAGKWSPYGTEGSEFLSEFFEDDANLATLQQAKAPKLALLVRTVNDHLMDDENKVVIFTSYVEMADIIVETLGGVVYTGALNATQKEAAKVQFQTDPATRVLVSTDAGGYGVDLPQANLLINYDLPWSAGLAVQRNGRIRRASSQWPSIVIQDILTSETVEERQYSMLRHKTAVADAVIDGLGINESGGVDTSIGALAEFLRENQP